MKKFKYFFIIGFIVLVLTYLIAPEKIRYLFYSITHISLFDKPKPTLDFLIHESDYYREDKTIGFIHQPNAKRKFNWPEHRNTVIVMRTNNMGFREDQDTQKEKASGVLRVLVTGDSHTDGVVNNAESFPNVLEDLLNRSNNGPRFEVINGGTGYYDPQHYLLFLKKYLSLKPDYFIVALYTGNDMLGTARIVEPQVGAQERPEGYFELIREQSKISQSAVSQGLNQIYYFKQFNDVIIPVEEQIARTLNDIYELCQQNSIGFITVFIPTKPGVEWDSDRKKLDRIAKNMGLSDSDLKITESMKDSIVRIVNKRGIQYLDPWRDMNDSPVEFFWKRDYHLNVSGHRFIANGLYEKMQSSLN